jgi:hypothetical protein
MKARDCSRSPVSLASDAGDLCFGNVVPLPGGTQATNGPRLDEAPRLRFESPNDAMDFARKSVEQSRRWLAARDLTVAQRYKQGHAHLTIIVEASSGMHPSKLELLLCAIPTVYKVAWPFNDERIAIRVFYKNVGNIDVKLEDKLVFIRPRNPAHRVEQVIASAVWLECLDQADDLARDAAALATYLPVDRPGVRREREVAVPLRGAELDGGGVDGLIKRVPQVVEAVGSNDAQPSWDRLNDPDFAQVVSGLTVKLGDWSASAAFDESLTLKFKLVDVFPCPVEE